MYLLSRLSENFTSGLILPFPVGKAQMQIDAIFFREIATAKSFSVKSKRAHQQNTNLMQGDLFLFLFYVR